MSIERIILSLKKNKRFLITTHKNLEGDALGSEIAFYKLLKKMGKTAIILNKDDTPHNYRFLPKLKLIKKFNKNIKNIKFDCLVMLDCSDLNRAGKISRINRAGELILNIDHHISNQKFGQINWVDPQASSCCEMIYRLYKKLHIHIDRESAVCLYVGMLTDTGCFHYTNTNSLVHKAVSEFLKYNIDVSSIYKYIYENIPFDDMKLLSRILSDVMRDAEGKIIWFQLKRNLLKNKKLCFDLSEQILNFGRAIKDAEVVVLFKEDLGVKNEIRVNFRSQGEVDVNRIAAYFGGGGHKTASGATIKGTLTQVRRKVLAKIREYLK